MKKTRLLLLLALLMTAATGAWAQDAKHLITATYREQTRSLEQPLPYATTIGELYEAVSGQSFSDLISSMSSVGMPLTGITSRNTSIVSIGEFNGASTPVTVIADGETIINLIFGSYVQGIPVSATSPLYAYMKDGVKDADKWTASTDGTNFGALPIGGLKGDGSETVTLQYSGRLKVKGVTATSDAEPAAQVDPLAVPMTIEAITAGAIKVSSPKEGMQYSLDGGKTKNAVTTDDIVLNVGDKVQFYGNGTSITSYDGTNITSSGDGFTCKVYGNIMSLVDETGFATATTLSANNTFYSLFFDFITLTDASGLLLPATQLAANCYRDMFYGCTALTAAPALPATQLANNCYQQMFKSCTALTAAPELPATQLSNNCYYRMFQGCASLTTAPALPATQLASSCYREMFSICARLTTAPVLPAETLVSNCYNQMFYNCSKLATVTCLATSGINQSGSTTRWLQSAGTQAEDTKTVYTISTADWPTMNNNGIPDGWTRVNVDN